VRDLKLVRLRRPERHPALRAGGAMMRVVLTGVGVVTPGVAGGRGELAAALRGHAPRGGSRVAADALASLIGGDEARRLSRVCQLAVAGGLDELDPLVDEVLGAMGAGDELRGEGAAFVVLEAEDAARARGARVLGELAGVASRALPARVGGVGRRATSRAIGAALEQAGLGTGDIGHVFTSASGDGQRNRWEEALLEAALAPHRPARTSLATRVGRHAGAGP